ncbi:spore coat protein CotH, partial [Paenibacillus sp. MCAF20]
VELEGNIAMFSWDFSFDLQGDDLVYDFTFARDPSFTNVIKTMDGLKQNKVTVEGVNEGYYYWKVIARDSGGNKQISIDYYTDHEGNEYPGVRELEVE